MNKLIEWKDSKYRKPLILRGARQVGKTYLLKEFARYYYEDMAYFNFDHDEALRELFLNTKDPKRIIEQLSFVVGKKIKPGATLIIFDEVQECPNALNSLKYFEEETPEYHIVAAGSLLGIKLSHTSFPVGKIDYLTLYPMTFSEFLLADGKENLVEYMKSLKEIREIPKIFEEQLIEQLKKYYIIGGMPEVVNSWVNDKDIERVNYLQKNILLAYKDDFSKHLSSNEAVKVAIVWDGIPSQLAKDNKKFVYQTIKEGARAREYESALNWLNDANLVYKCYNLNKCAFPLTSYNDLSAFKIYLLDVGLLRRMTDLDSNIIIEGDRLFEEFSKLCGYHCFKLHPLVCHWMIEAQYVSVKTQSAERVVAITVFDITTYRMSHVCRVNTYLILAPCLQLVLYQRMFSSTVQYIEMGNSIFATIVGRR